jgi:integrase
VLTARTIETLKPGASRKELPDRHLPGLYLVLQPSGAKSWAVRYRAQGRTRKHTLGAYPAIDLKTARQLAAQAVRAVAEGRDPGREKAQARTSAPDTVEAVARQFLDIHCRRRNRPNTIDATERLLRLHVLPRWGKRLAKDITRRDVLDLLDTIVDGGRPVAANRVLAAVRALFNWAIDRDIVVASPCLGVKMPAPETPRDRTLDDAELAVVWRAAETLGGPFGTLVQLLILLGQRRDEVARGTWDEIDLEAKLWRLPAARCKNGRAHDVPLSGAALDILAALPGFAGGKFMLTTDGGQTASSNYGKGKQRLDRLLPPDFPPFVLHDLRRSVASGMARIGVALPTVEKVLNHTSGTFAGIVGVYQKHDFAQEKQRALAAWGRHMMMLASGEPAEAKIVKLR